MSHHTQLAKLVDVALECTMHLFIICHNSSTLPSPPPQDWPQSIQDLPIPLHMMLSDIVETRLVWARGRLYAHFPATQA